MQNSDGFCTHFLSILWSQRVICQGCPSAELCWVWLDEICVCLLRTGVCPRVRRSEREYLFSSLRRLSVNHAEPPIFSFHYAVWCTCSVDLFWGWHVLRLTKISWIHRCVVFFCHCECTIKLQFYLCTALPLKSSVISGSSAQRRICE